MNELEKGYVRCEYSNIEVTTRPETVKTGAHLVDFGDVKHWIPKKLCRLADNKHIDIKEWKYIELGL